jgi:hypothetical protein
VLAGLYNGGLDLNAQTLTSAALRLNNTIPTELKTSVLEHYDAVLDTFGGVHS